MLVGLLTSAPLLAFAAIPLIGGGVVMQFVLPPPARPSRTLSPPVTGRWMAVNSPATKVPSHGLHAYGQTYAVDLVYDPDDRGAPRTVWWPLARPARTFASFGGPILSPAEGVVVTATDWQRDHWSRTSWPALAHLRRRSLRAKKGDRVHAGDAVAQCGNSGNTTEPHLHIQVMDHRWPLVAGGVPFAMTGVEIEDGDVPGLPRDERHLIASEPLPVR